MIDLTTFIKFHIFNVKGKLKQYAKDMDGQDDDYINNTKNWYYK